ncbi:MAG: chemotaxis-specific protein-glutamate methyltransferase CheB [Candidatus Hodarchaeota archaeon]
MKDGIKVLLVDDSAIFRYTITKILKNSGKNIRIIETAVNGKNTLKKMERIKDKVDIIVMDIVMPEMDGIKTVGYIMDRFPTPVILSSSQREKKEIDLALSDLGMSNIESGVVEFVKKPDPTYPNDRERFEKELILKIESLSKLDFSRIFSILNLKTKIHLKRKKTLLPRPPSYSTWDEYRDKIIVIGTSTGGPRAVSILLSMLPSNFPPIILVQHMPDGMITPWTKRLQSAYSQLKIRLAWDGAILQPGSFYVAPTGKHCIVKPGKWISLVDGEKVNFVIPSVDVTFRSAANVYGRNTLGIILTGMGKDGYEGAKRIKLAGGKIIAEHQSTCIMDSMPDTVIKADLADRISPIHQIAKTMIGIGWI